MHFFVLILAKSALKEEYMCITVSLGQYNNFSDTCNAKFSAQITLYYWYRLSAFPFVLAKKITLQP